MIKSQIQFILYSAGLVFLNFFVAGLIVMLPYIKADKIESLETTRVFMQYQQQTVLAF